MGKVVVYYNNTKCFRVKRNGMSRMGEDNAINIYLEMVEIGLGVLR
jgi:hypothetical protein